MSQLETRQNLRDQVNNTSDGRVNLINGNGTTYTADTIHIGNLSETNPHNDKARIEDEKGPHNQALCKWIFEHPSFSEWCHSHDSRFLWIKGAAGKGKTMLLAGIINKISIMAQEQQPDDSSSEPVVVTYFFCQRNDQRINKATAVLRGLIYLLVEQREVLMKHWKEPPEDKNTIFELSNILENMLGEIEAKTYLIVDAVDECETGLEQLLGRTFQIISRRNNARWLVSSRDKSLTRLKDVNFDCTKSFQIELDAHNISPVVDMYIDAKLSDLQWAKQNAQVRAQVRAKICEKADSTFLWVFLFFLWLSLRLEDEENLPFLQILDDAPSELHHMANLTLLKMGYQQYTLFKKNHCREYQRLETAKTKYVEAISAARSLNPIYTTGIIKGYISLAECHRELSHRPKISLLDKMTQVKVAEKYLNKAQELLHRDGIPDEVLLQRVRLDRAVLSARGLLVEMRQRNATGTESLGAKRSKTKIELTTLKEHYEKFGNRTSANWVDYWLKKLDMTK
ncbi:NACHT domain-containing protein [Tricladium varicosporioides]|nr:NACHT domain-containing protein [Hymenoscyphus varicosporioides]